MKSSKIIFGTFVLLALTAASGFAQQEFTLVTTNENTRYGSRVEINVPELSGNPQAIFVVTPLGDTEKLNQQPLGAWYYNDKWNISNTDGTRIVPGLRYKIQYFLKPGANQFLHIISKENLGDEGSYLDHPGLNNDPNAQFKILQNHAPDNRPAYNLNRNEAKAFYNSASGKWYIKNVNGERLSVKTAYNIVVFSSGAVVSNTPKPSPTPTAIVSKTPTPAVSTTPRPAASVPTAKPPTTDAIPLTFGNLNDFAEKGLPAANALPTGNPDQAAATMARQINAADEQSLPVLLAALQMAGFTVIDKNGKVLLKPADGKGQGLGFYDFEAVGSQKLAHAGIVFPLEKIAATLTKNTPQLSGSQLAEALLKDLRTQAENTNNSSVRFYARLIIELGKSASQPFDMTTAPASRANLSALQASLLLRRVQGDFYTLKHKQTGTNQPPSARQNLFVSAKWSEPPLFTLISFDAKQKTPCPMTGNEALILDGGAAVISTGQGALLEAIAKSSQTLSKVTTALGFINIALTWGKLVASVMTLRGEITVDNPPLIRNKNFTPGEERLLTARVWSEVGEWEMLNCLRLAINASTGLDFNLPSDGPLGDTFIEWQFEGDNKIEVNNAAKRNLKPPFVFFKPPPGADPKPNKQRTDDKGISKMYLVGSPKIPAVVTKPMVINKKAKVLVAVTFKTAKDLGQNLVDLGGTILGVGAGVALGGPTGLISLIGAIPAEIGYRQPWVAARATIPVIDHEPCSEGFWTLDYIVTVKGNGEKADAGSSSTIVWSIDRTYEGSAVLNDRNIYYAPEDAEMLKNMTPQMMMELAKEERKLRFSNTKDSLLNIQIDDRTEIITREECGDNTDEDTLEISTLKADGSYPGRNETLLTDNQLRTYNVLIPVATSDRNAKATLSKQTKYGRTGGVAPSKANSSIAGTQVDIPGPPNVLSLIKGVIFHAPDRPFPDDSEAIILEFNSGEMMPDEPLIYNVPDSKTNVKIRVIYRFTKGCK